MLDILHSAGIELEPGLVRGVHAVRTFDGSRQCDVVGSNFEVMKAIGAVAASSVPVPQLVGAVTLACVLEDVVGQAVDADAVEAA